MTTDRVTVAVLGAGHIATRDFGVLTNANRLGDRVEIRAIADAVPGKAEAVASRFGIRDAFDSLEEMLELTELDAVINLTPIPAHAATSLAILGAGKHLVTEKPIATTMEDADAIVELAAANKLTVVCAPPNMLFPSRSEARRLVADGAIGKVAYSRVRASHAGPASIGSWPTDPTWFYQAGAGPLFDLGIYGVHEIIGILDRPAKRVSAFSGIAGPTRTVRGGPFEGLTIDVTADDNTVLLLDFGDGSFAVVDGSYTVNAARGPRLEIFGLGGTICVTYGIDQPIGTAPLLELYRLEHDPARDAWSAPGGASLARDESSVRSLGRAILLDDLARSLSLGHPPRLGADVARHALEILLAAYESAETGRVVDLETTFESPAQRARGNQPA